MVPPKAQRSHQLVEQLSPRGRFPHAYSGCEPPLEPENEQIQDGQMNFLDNSFRGEKSYTLETL